MHYFLTVFERILWWFKVGSPSFAIPICNTRPRIILFYIRRYPTHHVDHREQMKVESFEIIIDIKCPISFDFIRAVSA